MISLLTKFAVYKAISATADIECYIVQQNFHITINPGRNVSEITGIQADFPQHVPCYFKALFSDVIHEELKKVSL